MDDGVNLGQKSEDMVFGQERTTGHFARLMGWESLEAGARQKGLTLGLQ